MRLTTTIIAVVALAAFAAPAASGRVGGRARRNAPSLRGPDSAAVTAKEIEEGRSIFHGAGQCVTCHGDHLEGGPIAPTLRAHQWRDAKDGTFPEILRVVTHGVPGTAMVAYPGGIDDGAATNVAAYVWAVSHGKAQP